ncbi:MAG: InlB B-repeat-containing protein, partial [Bacteroidales bacterium]
MNHLVKKLTIWLWCSVACSLSVFAGTTPPVNLPVSSERILFADYTLTINIVGNGSVTPISGTVYPEGTVVSLDPQADPGWTFDSWSGGLTGSDDPASITMNSDVTVTATFTQDEYSLTLTNDGHGTASADHAGPYIYNESIELTATPNTGYSFTGWTGNFNSTANPATFNITQNSTVQANFTLLQYALTVQTDGTPGAIATGSGSVDHGVAASISVNVPAGYNFTGWTVTSGTASIADPSSASTTATLTTGAATVRANFSAIEYSLTLTNDGHGTASADH